MGDEARWLQRVRFRNMKALNTVISGLVCSDVFLCIKLMSYSVTPAHSTCSFASTMLYELNAFSIYIAQSV